MTVFGYRIPPLASLIFWAAIWEIVGRLDLVFLFPPFSHVVMELGEVATSQTFVDAAILTLKGFFWGLAIAILVGVPLGLLMGTVRAADRLLNMWVNLFVSAPLSALVPVLMILFGLGQATIIVTVVLFAVWIIAIDTRAGVKHISPSLLAMAKSFGASHWQMLTRITIMGALPEVLAGIRLGVIRGVKGVVIGQLLVSIIGVGALFALYQQNFLMAHFWALIIILFACALTLAELVARIEKRIEYYAGVRN